jgi:head-tail adaptor
VTHAGQFKRRITFRAQAVDPTTQENAGYADVATRDARVEPLRGQESVQAARMAGKQPVRITVRRENALEGVDNSWQAKDARTAADSPPVTIAWDILSAQVTEDNRWIEIEAVQRKGGDVA